MDDGQEALEEIQAIENALINPSLDRQTEFDNDHGLVVVAIEDMFEVCQKIHKDVGHQGRLPMIQEAKKYYANISRTVIELYLNYSEEYQLKRKKFRNNGLIVKPIRSNNFNERVQIDLIDFRTLPDGDYCWILNAQDHFLKVCWLRPLKAKSVKEVARALIDIFGHFGAPRILQSDKSFKEKIQILHFDLSFYKLPKKNSMLKFVKNIKKSSLNLNAETKIEKSNSQKSNDQNEATHATVSENDVEVNLSQNESENSSSTASRTEPVSSIIKDKNLLKNLINKLRNKKFLLFLISITLVIIALIILVVLVVFIIKFTRDTGSDLSKNKNQNTDLFDQSIINFNKTCNQLYECSAGFYSILINNQCYCHLFEHVNNFSQDRLICVKIKNFMYKCECLSGYQWSIYDDDCIDINECDFKTICTDDFSTHCINKLGSYECGCKNGFRWSELFQRCIDLNECLMFNETELCGNSPNTVCINTHGSYTCDCKSGFTKSSNNLNFVCLDVNECKTDRYTCTNSTCNNLDGSYECCKVFESEYECINCGYQFYKPFLKPSSNSTTSSLRIIGGIESKPYSWPWIVSIGFDYRYNVIDLNENTLTKKWLNISHVCGGTLISPYTVLTAAHCLYSIQAKIKSQTPSSENKNYINDLAHIVIVYVGVHDQSVDKKNRTFSHRVRKIYIHENFDSKILLNDIALLTLEKSVFKSYRINWACLGNILNFLFPKYNTTIYAAGFGSTNVTYRDFGSNILRQVDLKLLNFNDCDLVTSSMITNPLSQFCAGYLNGQKDTCMGDSGSPILYRYRSRWFVIGVVSYGQGCAQSFKPGINTNVSYYLDWINERVKL
ncbi:unnamed protein product [Brachionus calyciflorus]|uniref:Uncharacterized protein n=1 Tax=Brachionus calyciflorus TaxID=104777 RepID=A0A813RWE5_9BILA|nr:unnamed protein product [Brachionus calyciflorus]